MKKQFTAKSFFMRAIYVVGYSISLPAGSFIYYLIFES